MEKITPYYQKIIFVCINDKLHVSGKCCKLGGGVEIHRKLKEYVKQKSLNIAVRVSKSSCQDLCVVGPVVSVFPDNIVYQNVSLSDVDDIIAKHVDL